TAYVEGQHRVYKMVPFLSLDGITAKPSNHIPCPDERCTGNCFAAEVTSEDMVELQVGDLVYVLRDDVEPQSRKLFAVQPKGWKSVRIMRASKLAGLRFEFTTTNKEHKTEKYSAADVKVIGRVMLVVRNL